MTDKKEEYSIIAPPKRVAGECLGRTPLGWVKIAVFYVVLYSLLAAFFVGMLFVFFRTLDLTQPKWQNANGLIGTNPGLAIRPMSFVDKVDLVKIEFKHGEKGNWDTWTQDLERFLTRYETSSDTKHFTNCSFDQKATEGKMCSFDLELLGTQCSQKNNFGYSSGNPCVILKLNRIYGWVPEPYDNPNDLPVDMPADLKNHIKAKAAENIEQLKMVWVSCEGKSSPQNETGNMLNMTFTPFRGFPAYYFPYTNTPQYTSPIVALQIENTEVGTLYNFECKIWAKNIVYDSQRRLGAIRFDLFIE